MARQTVILLLIASMTSGCFWAERGTVTAPASVNPGGITTPIVDAPQSGVEPVTASKASTFKADAAEAVGTVAAFPFAVTMGLMNLAVTGKINPWE